jgi:predicted transcriptional regulator
MFGLGKKRSKFGRWLDKQEITQSELAMRASVGDMTISRLCNEKDYMPKYSTITKIQKALRQLGHDLPDDYFGM